MRSYGSVPVGTAVPYRHRDPAFLSPARLAELAERDRRRALLELPARGGNGQDAERKAAIARFAKLRARGLTVAQASDAMGVARSTGRGYARALSRRK